MSTNEEDDLTPVKNRDEELTSVKTQLIRTFPFLAFVVVSARYVFLDEEELQDYIPTMAATIIGGKATVLINETFMMKTLNNLEERSFVIAHELLHLYFQHLGRQHDRGYNPKIWNIATDYFINYLLCDLESPKLQMPEVGLFDEKYANQSSDQIYGALLEEYNNDLDKLLDAFGSPNDLDAGCQCGDGDDEGDDGQGGSGGDDGDDGDGDKDGKGKGGKQKEGQGGDQDGHGEGNGKMCPKCGAPKDGKGKDGKGGKRGVPFDEVGSVSLDADQKARLKAQLAASLQGGQLAGNMRNSALVKQLYKLVKPDVDWKAVLSDFITKSRDEFNTYKKYNSRSRGGIIFPSTDGEFIDLLFGIDTSGSMSDRDVTEGLTELKSIVDNYMNWRVKFITCEMDVEEVGDYRSENGDDFTCFSQDMCRGGGTDMNPMVRHAEEMDETPACVVIFTDGYVPEIMPSHVPVIVVVTRHGNKNYDDPNHVVLHIGGREESGRNSRW